MVSSLKPLLISYTYRLSTLRLWSRPIASMFASPNSIRILCLPIPFPIILFDFHSFLYFSFKTFVANLSHVTPHCSAFVCIPSRLWFPCRTLVVRFCNVPIPKKAIPSGCQRDGHPPKQSQPDGCAPYRGYGERKGYTSLS